MTQYQPPQETLHTHQLAMGTPTHQRVSWGTSIRVWWGVTWRGVVIAVPLGVFLGFATGIVIVITNSSANPGVVGGVLGQLATIPATIIGVHWFMNRGLRSLGIEVFRGSQNIA
jgi:hypothetical protein